jgi:hypothetical protein
VRELSQLACRILGVRERLVQQRVGRCGKVAERLPRQLEGEDRAHHALLCAVVQVALDPPPGLVGGGHDTRPRSGELGTALGVRDDQSDELGEVRHALFAVRRQRLADARRDQRSPWAVVDDDRARHR